jgi:hypothetical protein
MELVAQCTGEAGLSHSRKEAYPNPTKMALRPAA